MCAVFKEPFDHNDPHFMTLVGGVSIDMSR